jgi:hypothetical protein
MVESEPLPDRVLEMLRCDGHQNRVYVNQETNESVALILLVGRAGPMVAHTPAVCYESSAFEVVESTRPTVVRTVGDRSDTFDRVAFRSKSVDGGKQVVYHSWRRHRGNWEVPGNPRFALGGAPMLYKLQLAAAPEGLEETDVQQRFLADLLPVLDRLLAPR